MSILFSRFFQKINQIAPLETDFTEVLEHIAVKPKLLYFYGKMPENVSKTVAIVGSRRNTPYGEEVAYKMAYALAKRGVVIVSGLAYGIDSIGHRAALDAGGTTVAVLGTPIDKIYPKNHTALAAEIIEKGGAIMSEYAPRTPDFDGLPLVPGEYRDERGQRLMNPKLSFLHRNRLISGLSDVVVVVEAAERSGTLNTAAHALSQGREVFAVPGNITSVNSVGCNRLIAAGAYPYSEPDDILRLLYPEDYLAPQKSKKGAKIVGDTPVETAILSALKSGARSGEGIMARLKLSPETFNGAITLLEIKGQVRALGANNWSLA